MLASVQSCALLGVDAIPVRVEIDISYGMPVYSTIGLPDAAVRESRDRVKSAIHNCGLEFPLDRVIVSLAPADLRKEGALYDLPIALGILAASGQLPLGFGKDFLVMGELALGAQVRPTKGVLAAALLARDQGRALILPRDCLSEASVVEGVELIGVAHLSEAIAHLRGTTPLNPTWGSIPEGARSEAGSLDLAQVRGQESAKRALAVAATGNHNLLLIGAPGAGKTMLAQRMPGLLPPLSPREILETAKIYSAAGLLGGKRPLLTARPFRAPHHSISDVGLIGGGSIPRPGEISLAHHGVLFLDELTEFRRGTLEVLRQPLEDGEVLISRARCSVRIPCKILLIGALNPCPCGYYGDVGRRSCRCSPGQVRRYLGKISGPLLDRFDLAIRVHSVTPSILNRRSRQTGTSELRSQVEKGLMAQRERGQAGRNGQLAAGEMEPLKASLTPGAEDSLVRGAERLGLTARGYHRALKVARTIADLEIREQVTEVDVLEALSYRCTDLNGL